MEWYPFPRPEGRREARDHGGGVSPKLGSHWAEMSVWTSDPRGPCKNVPDKENWTEDDGKRAQESANPERRGGRCRHRQAASHEEMNLRLEITDVKSLSAVPSHLPRPIVETSPRDAASLPP